MQLLKNMRKIAKIKFFKTWKQKGTQYTQPQSLHLNQPEKFSDILHTSLGTTEFCTAIARVANNRVERVSS